MPYEEFFSNTPKVDITFPEETIVHALLAEQHLASAHDSLVDIIYEDNDKYDNFKSFTWNQAKRIFINDDIVMNCLSSLDSELLQNINERLKLDWDKFYVDKDNDFVNELSEPEKILYAIVKAVKDKYPQFAEFQEGCYDSDLILGAFYININIFHDDEGPYMTMNISLNDGFFEGVSW